ncbi:MAG: glycosyltransferase family 2 protein [Patescibacteria group bacterium]|jgi:hypothetical protein
MKKTKGFTRFLEMVPGISVWAVLLLPLILLPSFPVAIAIIVIIFDIYWLYKSLIMGYHLTCGYYNLKSGMKTDWKEKFEKLNNHDSIYQVLILASYKDDFEVLDKSIEAIELNDFDKNKIIVVLAAEEREKDRIEPILADLEKKYKHSFKKFLITYHPDNIEGEMKAKGANATWAARKLKIYLEAEKIDFEKVIVTTADSDTRIHRHYFNCVGYKFLLSDDPIHTAFQSMPIYSNNIWRVNPINRILAFGASFWQLIEGTRPWRLITFAIHAMSMQTLVDMNFWEVGVVNEDSRQFWRAYFHYNGRFKVVPIFLPASMDAVFAPRLVETLKNQYKQRQRWAYGIEHFPYVVQSTLKMKYRFFDKWIKVYRMLEGEISLATASFYISIIGWLPIWFNNGFKNTVLATNLPIVGKTLLSLTWVGLIITVWISLKLLPPRPAGFRKRKFIPMIAQWVLVPISAIFISSLSAIDSATRLMFGKYMGFWTTPKIQIDLPEKK